MPSNTPSKLNPSGSDDNCFFVAMAFLLDEDKSVNELPDKVVEIMNDPENANGVDPLPWSVEPILEATGKNWKYENWLESISGLDPEPKSEGGRAVWRDEQFMLSKWNVQKLAIGYATKNDKYHFIVLRESKKDGQPPEYLCFQHSEGTDLEGEVKGFDVVKGEFRDAMDKEQCKVLCAFAFLDDDEEAVNKKEVDDDDDEVEKAEEDEQDMEEEEEGEEKGAEAEADDDDDEEAEDEVEK